MFKTLVEKALENSNLLLNGGIQRLSESRKEELELMKNKVRNSPDEVEEWFENEITKISNLNGSSIKDTINTALKKNANSVE
jgi:hypothetical protein